MSRVELAFAVLLAAIFALFAMLRFDVLDRDTLRFGVAAFLFAFYCGVVAFGTEGKKRKLSVFYQVILGVGTALAIAGVVRATPTGYAAALLLGLILGFTADWWVKHIDLP